MKRSIVLILLIPVLIGAIFLAGCEDDDAPSGTATVTGNVRQFYTDTAVSTTARAKAAAGVTIELRTTDGSYSAFATSEADGTFRFENVPAGDFELILTDGGTTGKLTFTVPDGATVELVDIVVKKDGTVYEGEIVKAEESVIETAEETAPVTAPSPKVQWIDQKQDVADSVNGFSAAGYGYAQGFTVGATNGAAIKVELKIGVTGSPNAGLTVSIRSALGGADLASATVASSDLDSKLQWKTITFDTPANLAANTKYYIVLTTTSAAGPFFTYWWGENSSNPYAGGGPWKEKGAGNWVPSSLDFVFKVWLEN